MKKLKKILFIHPSFSGQFRYLMAHCAKSSEYQVDFITEALPCGFSGVTMHQITDTQSQRSESTAVVLRKLCSQGYRPDVIVCHSGWGHDLYVAEIFPSVPVLSYPEWFHPEGDPRNEILLKALEHCRAALVPTQWQKSQFPVQFQEKIKIIHEGVDTEYFKPDDDAVFSYHKHQFKHGDEVITYAARGLEPIRGFPEFMRALPGILRARPKARVIIAGDERNCYGLAHPSGKSWRSVLENELKLPSERVIFCGKVGESYLLKIFQISSLHIYMSRPFILSWSVLEAMSTGCLVLGSATEPVLEILHNRQNGITCELNSTSIAQNVITILENPEKFQLYRKVARKFIEQNFNAKTCVQQQLKLLQSITDV